MKCNYLNDKDECTASPTIYTHYKPNVEEKQNFCFNELEIRSCPRLQIYHDYLELSKTESALSVQNVNTNVNTNLVFNQQITDAFNKASNEVEARDISDDLKEEISMRLTALEAELKKEIPNKGRIQRLGDWIKKNANWVFPMIARYVEEALKKATGA